MSLSPGGRREESRRHKGPPVAGEQGTLDEAELTARLLARFQSPGYHPPRLPSVAMQILALSHNDAVEFEQLEALLEQDPLLAGEVLGIARSAAYAGVGRVHGLRDALVRLGLDKLREVVLLAAVSLRVFRSRSYGYWMERLRRHSYATAHLARVISRYTPLAEEQAFLCGLLHDAGIAGILLALGDVGADRRAPELDPLWPAIHAAHRQAGARMVALWGLAPDVSLVVGAHHDVEVQGFDHPGAAIVCLAESLTVEVDMALPPVRAGLVPAGGPRAARLEAVARIDRSQPSVIERARRALDFSDATLGLILEDARAWAKASADPAGA